MSVTYRPGRDPSSVLAAAALLGARLAAEHLLSVSDRLVPIEEGTLSRSGATSARSTPGGAVAAVSYGTPYAVPQHERLDYRHDPGRQAKYLESPMSTERATMARIVAQALREALT